MRSPLLVLCLALSVGAHAQKKPLDPSVYDRWESVGQTTISPSGNLVSYLVKPQEGDGVLHVRVFGKKGREIVIPRAYRFWLSRDERHAVCLIKPEYLKTRQARIEKKRGDALPQDSLAVIDLQTGALVKYASVKGFEAGEKGNDAVAFTVLDSAAVRGKGKKSRALGSTVAVHYFAGGRVDTLKQIDQYLVSKDGRQLAFVRKTDKERSVVGFYDLLSHRETLLADTTAWHHLACFDEEGGRALYLEAGEAPSGGSRHPRLMLYDIALGKASVLAEASDRPIDLTEKSSARFSQDGHRVFTDIYEVIPPKDSNLVSFETPGLDIWKWDAPLTPPEQEALKEPQHIPALVSGGRLIPASGDFYDRIRRTPRDASDRVLAIRYQDLVAHQWDVDAPKELCALSLERGERQRVCSGVFEEARLSPDGNAVLWFDLSAGQWMYKDLVSGALSVLTEGLDVSFADEENDCPRLAESYGFDGWLKDGSVLVYDRYDIWKLSPGAATRLTSGREKQITYRILSTRPEDADPAIALDETLYLSTFDNVSKEGGIVSLGLSKRVLRAVDGGPYSFQGLEKAAEGQALIYTKGNFREPMDLYYVPAPGKKAEKLTALNPQIADYNWGTVDLYQWKAFDGTPLEGLLYKPEDFDPDRKYPVIIYFYERNSHNLYTHYEPRPTQSIVNIPYFVSRGYVVFVPDVVYTPGLPGESAYNCIVSGAESLRRFPWIDGANMGIQGQSWGGYQVAYLITRTDMFKAAGAGAPVVNMTSAYGGIRWKSGMSRQFQYEHTQSRIGKDLWSGLERYMENSPLFRLPKVTTPVLIMHNDEDGAVPWYQGIEMFMGLRRLGKPAWLLQYNGEAHNLRQRRNRRDLSLRLQQFFDHYLKGAPAPVWMTDGVPTSRKGFDFGYGTAD